eukprot:TCONS_00072947-protein
MAPVARLVMAIVHLLLGFIGLPTNGLAAYLIIKTRQFENQSTRLVMYLSIFDGIGSIIINGASAMYMLAYEEIDCVILLVVHGIVNLSIFCCFSIIVLIGFDRLLRILYLNDYSLVFSEGRYKVSLIVAAVSTVIQSILIFIGFYMFGYGYATMFSLPINVIGLVFMIICYCMSISKLKEMNERSRQISNTDRSVVRIASLHLAMFVCCFTPTVIWQVVNKLLLSKFLPGYIDILVVFGLYVLVSVHSSFNGFIFLTVNREARQQILRFFNQVMQRLRRFFNREQVAPAVPVELNN